MKSWFKPINQNTSGVLKLTLNVHTYFPTCTSHTKPITVTFISTC